MLRLNCDMNSDNQIRTNLVWAPVPEKPLEQVQSPSTPPTPRSPSDPDDLLGDLEAMLPEVGLLDALAQAPPSHAASAAPPRDTPEATATSLTGPSTVISGVRAGSKRSLQEQEALRVERKLAKESKRLRRDKGAIVASTRTGEGYSLPSGKQKTCLPDAAYNGLLTVGFKGASLQKLRKHSVPELGNTQEASWFSTTEALLTLGYPVKLVEVTKHFRIKGGPMLSLLTAPAGIYLGSQRRRRGGRTAKNAWSGAGASRSGVTSWPRGRGGWSDARSRGRARSTPSWNSVRGIGGTTLGTPPRGRKPSARRGESWRVPRNESTRRPRTENGGGGWRSRGTGPNASPASPLSWADA